jgi:D-amino-acid dehydrogenase
VIVGPSVNASAGAPGRVLVVGAGIVGLSVAWSLQEYGVDVQVIDRRQVAAGASWGNAGYVSPAEAVPLPEPAILRYGLRAALDPRSPVSLPVRGDLRRARFLGGLVRHCTHAAWRQAMSAYRPLNEAAIEAYDAQQASGVSAPCRPADVIAAFSHPDQARGLFAELQGVVGSGQSVDVGVLTGEQTQALEPHLSAVVRFGVVIRGQRYLNPAEYVTALADTVRSRGGKIVEGAPVTSVARHGTRVVARTSDGDLDADAIVLATGAWLSALAGPHGVAVPVHAGRGYSFTVPVATPLTHPVHFPATRAAITPAGDRVRVVGIMEFAGPDRPLARARIKSVVNAVRPLVTGFDWDGRANDWVGPRPLTTDGIPLAGRTATDGIYVAGGHGMWGITLGPVTGRLLAEQIATGRTPPALAPLDPRR